jgi:hypothetical protein
MVPCNPRLEWSELFIRHIPPHLSPHAAIGIKRCESADTGGNKIAGRMGQ